MQIESKMTSEDRLLKPEYKNSTMMMMGHIFSSSTIAWRIDFDVGTSLDGWSCTLFTYEHSKSNARNRAKLIHFDEMMHIHFIFLPYFKPFFCTFCVFETIFMRFWIFMIHLDPFWIILKLFVSFWNILNPIG